MNKYLKVTVFLIVLFGCIAVFLTVTPKRTLAQTLTDSPTKVLIAAADNTGAQTASTPDTPLSQRIADPKGYVYLSWQALRVVINLVLILALLAISFSNILRININSYAVKKALPNLIIGVILANASFFIVKLFADFASATVFLFINLAGQNSLTGFVQKIIQSIAGTAGSTLNGCSIPLCASFATSGTSTVLTAILSIVVAIIAIVGLLWLAVILYVRLVVIYLLTILSPLAFLAYGIPGLEKYFKQWWQLFTKWMFMLTALCAVFWVQYKISTIGSGSTGSLAQTITIYVIFFFALSLPSKLGGSIVDKTSTFLKNNSLTKAASDNAKLYGSAAGSVLGAATGYTRIQELNKLRTENLKKTIENRRNRSAANVRGGFFGYSMAGRKAAKLDYQSQIISNDKAGAEANNANAAFTDSLAEKLNKSDFAKTTAEKLKEIDASTKKIEFYTKATQTRKDANGKDITDANGNKIPENKRLNTLINNFAEASSKAAALTDAVSTEEKKAVGGYTNRRLDALSAAQTYADLQKEMTDKGEAVTKADQEVLEAARVHGAGSVEHRAAQANAIGKRREFIAVRNFNTPMMVIAKNKFDAVKTTHKDLATRSIDEIAGELNSKTSTVGTILKAEKIKQIKSYNGGIQAMTEDMIKNGSVDILTSDKDFEKFADGTHGNIVDLAGGTSVNVDMDEQDKFQKYVYTLKSWMSSSNNPNYRGAIDAGLATFVEHGGQRVKLSRAINLAAVPATATSPALPAINADHIDSTNIAAIKARLASGTLSNQDERALLSTITSGLNNVMSFGGDPGRHINTSY